MLATYRIYFRSPSGELLGREEFEGEDDRAAMVIAEMLHRTCSDLCDDFELWQGSRRVDACYNRRFQIRSGELNSKTQKAVAQCEERLRDSHWSIAKSKRLLAQLDRLLGGAKGGHEGPGDDRQQRLVRTIKLAIENAALPKKIAHKARNLRLKPAPSVQPDDSDGTS
jgi:hypothetical protein